MVALAGCIQLAMLCHGCGPSLADSKLGPSFEDVERYAWGKPKEILLA